MPNLFLWAEIKLQLLPEKIYFVYFNTKTCHLRVYIVNSLYIHPPQPWVNLRLAWLVVSEQLESTLFNSSLALCLAVTGQAANFIKKDF